MNNKINESWKEIIVNYNISIYILFRSLSSKYIVHVAIPQWFYSHIILAINELNDLVQKKQNKEVQA